jgi:hypothetical protein
MTNQNQRDIVIDNNIMSLYDSPKDENIKMLFRWLREEGTLTASKNLIKEYRQSGNQKLVILINELNRKGRYLLITKSEIDSFKIDRHFNYTCNYKDREHAKLVFLSIRKRLIANDNKLVHDVNSFKKVNGIKPCACKNPQNCCYK